MRHFFRKYRRESDAFDLEEAMMDQSGKNFEVLEIPLKKDTFRIFTMIAILLGVIIMGRVIYLGVWSGDFYVFRATANMNKEVVLPAPRGIIFDRFGTPLVENRSTFDVYVRVSDFLKDKEGISEALREVLTLDEGEIDELVHKADIEKSDLVLVTHDIDRAQVIALQNKNIEGISTEDSYRRSYPFGSYFSHVVGYIDAARNQKTGLEAYYDDILKGEDGEVVKHRNAKGQVIDASIFQEAQSGKSLTTTLDAGLQKYLSERLRAGLASLGRVAGVAIALNPRSGEVLALVSLPSFDSNIFASSGFNDEKKKALVSSKQALFNRAISGLYSPASTIKPLVAVAALNEGVIDTQKSILSIGYIEIPNPYNPDKPSRFLDWRAHGWVDMYSALARSSDVYFYEVGGGFEGVKGLGINKLHDWWVKFFLGAKLGIDLPGERSGFLPSAEEKEKRTGQIWRIGDTYNVSIGQGDLLVTPLGLINYIAAIANGGTIYRPYLNKEMSPLILNDLTSLGSEIKEVQQGMRDGVIKSYGTSHMLDALPFTSSGKTGTAQINNNTKTNAFFTGYMPAENPEIALLVLVEDSVEGSLNAVPVARDVFSWYYEHRIRTNSTSTPTP